MAMTMWNEEREMKYNVLFGTESGNAEMAAEDLVEHIEESGGDAEVFDLSEFTHDQFSVDESYIFVCSTYGEGDLPNTAVDFYETLGADRDDLSGLHYSVFGLGDSFYEKTFTGGSKTLDDKLAELGGQRLGDFGVHDASSFADVTETLIEWFGAIEPLYADAGSMANA